MDESLGAWIYFETDEPIGRSYAQNTELIRSIRSSFWSVLSRHNSGGSRGIGDSRNGVHPGKIELEARTEEGKHMTDTSRPFAEKKFPEVKGHRIPYTHQRHGPPIISPPPTPP